MFVDARVPARGARRARGARPRGRGRVADARAARRSRASALVTASPDGGSPPPPIRRGSGAAADAVASRDGPGATLCNRGWGCCNGRRRRRPGGPRRARSRDEHPPQPRGAARRSARTQAIARGGLGVTRIAEMLGREKSQVSRTLKMLADFGLVDRDPDTLAYRLGWRIFALASLAGERRLLDDARPVLRRLVRRVRGARVPVGAAGRRHADDPVRVADYAVQAVGWVGRVSPAYCTSVGQALLMDHDRPELEPRVPRHGVPAARPEHRPQRRASWPAHRRGARARLRRSPTRSSSSGSSPPRRRCATARPHRGRAQRLRAQVPLRRARGRGGRRARGGRAGARRDPVRDASGRAAS